MRLLGALIVGVCCTSPAFAQVLAKCGASSGYTYILPGGMVESKDAGWSEDGIKDGQVILVRDGDKLDLIYTDAVGARSAKADGATLVEIPSPTSTVVVVVYTNAVETWQFYPSGDAVWTQQKYGGLIDKVAAFHSKCE